MKLWLKRWRRLGWPAALAAALTLAAALGAAWLSHGQAGLQAQRHDLARQRAALAARRLPADAKARDAESLRAALPPDSQRAARTAALLGLATELGLPWPRSEFRYEADRELGVAQYRVAMQVDGRYGAVRDFVAEALRRDPALALDGVHLRRDAARPGEVRAELAWVLLMQGAR